MFTCSRHMRAQTSGQSFIWRTNGDCVLICAPVERIRFVASFTTLVLNSTGWLKCAIKAKFKPLSTISLNRSINLSESLSVVYLYGQKLKDFVPILIVCKLVRSEERR